MKALNTMTGNIVFVTIKKVKNYWMPKWKKAKTQEHG